MDKQTWDDLLACIIFTEGMAQNRSNIESAKRAREWLTQQEWQEPSRP